MNSDNGCPTGTRSHNYWHDLVTMFWILIVPAVFSGLLWLSFMWITGSFR